jgi:hypothetical protein
LSDSIAEIIITAMLSMRMKKKKKKCVSGTEEEVCVCNMYVCVESYLQISLRRIIDLHINSEVTALTATYLSEDEGSYIRETIKKDFEINSWTKIWFMIEDYGVI